MPEDNKAAQVPDVPWQDLSFKFNGQWMPDMDSTLIGPDNYQTLQNLRYTEDSLEMIPGYTKVNTTPLSSATYGTDYVEIQNGHQLTSTKTQTSYNLVQSASSGGQGRVFLNRTAAGSVGQFQTAAQVAAYTVQPLDTSGHYYRADVSSGLQGRFSKAPQGNVAYCNGEESTIFGGDEQRVAACFSFSEAFDAEIITNAADHYNRTFEGTNDWANGGGIDNFDNTTGGYLAVSTTGNGEYCSLAQAQCATTVGTKYRLTFDYTYTSGAGSWGIIEATSDQLIGSVFATKSYVFDYVAQSTGGLSISSLSALLTGGRFDNFSLKALTITDQIDVTDRVSNILHTSSDDLFTMSATDKSLVLLFTTRPIEAIKMYVDSANASDSTMTVKTWLGQAGWSGDLVLADKTALPGAKSLAQTGTIIFSSHTDGTSVPMHFEELYLYAYKMELSAGSADIYHITVNPAMQTIKDVWDGVYRQPIQFQVLDNTIYYDYTLQVQESSDLSAPIGGVLDSLGTSATDSLFIVFEDKMSAIKFTMLGDRINLAPSIITMDYWNGEQYQDVVITDGTFTSGGISFSKTGLVSWQPPEDEEPITLFGSFGYAYKFTFSGAMTGTAADDTSDIVVDICTGIPAQNIVPPFNWSAVYGSRLILGGYTIGDEGNRMDYSVSNAPDVWNGFDSSDNGKQSLYFGGVEAIVAGTQIYNRFGANVYSMLLVLKQSEVYILVGDTPEEFTIYPVAKTIGCVAPLSLATAEIGMDLGGGLTRNIAMWLSHSGPMMFDGAVLLPIAGISSYFDPTDSKYIKFSLMSKAIGWFDYTYKEYNILIPSGSAATANNTWLVFDLAKRKWFEKVTHASHYPQSGWEVVNPDTGQRYTYAGKQDGFMVQLETGTYWDDGVPTGIVQSVTTGDFYPTNNMWDVTTLRKHKLLVKELTQVGQSANTATIKHYLDTEEEAYTVGTFDMANVKGTQKLVRVVNNMNKTGVQHAFNYSVTTLSEAKGLQPIAWGVEFRQERKDNTAT